MRSSWLFASLVIHSAAVGAAVGFGAYAGLRTPRTPPRVEVQRTVAAVPAPPSAQPLPPLEVEEPLPEPLPPEPAVARPIEPPAPAPQPTATVQPPVRPTMQRIVVAAAPVATPPPPPEAPAAEPSASVEPERCADNEPPVYPPRERRLGHEGVVVLRVLVSAGGEVLRVEVQRSSGHAGLDREAVRAARSWRFTPGLRHGEPFACTTDVEVEFVLRD